MNRSKREDENTNNFVRKFIMRSMVYAYIANTQAPNNIVCMYTSQYSSNPSKHRYQE